MKLSIIGGGNLGAAIAKGMAKADFFKSITVSRRNPDAIASLLPLGIVTSGDNIATVKDAKVIILAVKPHQIKSVAEEIAPYVGDAVLISVITGVEIKDLATWFGKDKKIVRAMPNTAIAQAASMTCVSLNSAVQMEDKELVSKIFEALGELVFIDEKLMDAATVICACGTAYVMRFMRAMMQGGIQIGFDANTAQKIVAQTVKGAAMRLQQENSHPEAEIDKVTTPQGCTIAGLNEMEHAGFSSALIKGINTSYQAIGGIAKD